MLSYELIFNKDGQLKDIIFKNVEVLKKIDGRVSLNYIIKYKGRKAVVSFPKKKHISMVLMKVGEYFFYSNAQYLGLAPKVYESNIHLNHKYITYEGELPYIVREYIVGKTIQPQEEYLDMLARNLANLHTETTSDKSLIFVLTNRLDKIKIARYKSKYLTFYKLMIYPIIEKEMAKLQILEPFFEFIITNYEYFLRMFDASYVLCHGDLFFENVIESRGRLIFIDASFSSIFFPFYDFIKLYRFFAIQGNTTLFEKLVKKYLEVSNPDIDFSKFLTLVKFTNLVFSIQTVWFFKTQYYSEFWKDVYNLMIKDFKELYSITKK